MDPGIVVRRLRGAGVPTLEILEAGPRGAGAPLLLVHGAFAGAWTWAERLMPFLARRGRHVLAVSLRGHGGSEGHDALQGTGLADYGADLRRVLAELPAPPVVVGHSLGGLIAQQALGRAALRGLVLVGSLPPEGLAFIAPRLAFTEPGTFAEALMGSLGQARAPVSDAHWRMLFSEGLLPEQAARYAARMQPESPRALAEALWPGPVASAAMLGVPALVLAGGGDRLVLAVSSMRTAVYHGARLRFFPEMGHFLMLDPTAEDAARALLDWLDDRGL
ncbi:MAG TPA: alpha/beta fold hydrolase [Salinarimonas sp.]|nr:alpha/beta fold hydrolase [Salinarimonas sp.]